MQKYTDVVQNRLGLVIEGANVRVTDINGSVATIFSNNGTIQQDNPMTTDANGRFSFYAADGRYNITVTVDNVEYGEQRDILLNDPSDPSPEKIIGGVITESSIEDSDVLRSRLIDCESTGGLIQNAELYNSTIRNSSLENVTIDGLKPMTIGGQENINDNSRIREALRLCFADAGLNLVEGSFEEGGELLVASDVMITASGAGYSWSGVFPKVVNAGSTPIPLGSGGWVDRSYATLRNELTSDAGATLTRFKPSGVAEALANISLQSILEDCVNVRSFMPFGTVRQAIEAAISWSNGGAVFLPSSLSYDTLSADVVNITMPVTLIGEGVPSYDPETDTKSGTWINGVVSANGVFAGVGLINIGVDSRNNSTNEGITMSGGAGATQIRRIRTENLIVLGKPTNNHCFLIEGADDVICKNTTVAYGIQGLAIKATNFLIDGVVGIDTTTWSVTVRESPDKLCRHGRVRNVLTKAVNNTKCGGVVLMNSQQGVQADDITFEGLNLDKGALFIDNTNNTVGTTNIKVRDVNISGASGYAMQTFGPVDGLDADGVVFDGCVGSIYTNQAPNCKNFNIRNVTLRNTGTPARISGSDHIVSGWKKSAGPLAVFIQNESTNLQYHDMDVNVPAVAGLPGGSIADMASVVVGAQGNLPRQKRQQLFFTYQDDFVQNQTRTIFTLPVDSSKVNADITITAVSVAGAHVRRFALTNNIATAIAGSASASAVIDLVRSGTDISFKYIFGTAGNVTMRAQIDITFEY